MKSYLSGEEAEKFFQSYKIIRRAFPTESCGDLLDLLELCRKNDGLFAAPLLDVVIGVFRYNPGQKVGGREMIDIVRDYDIETLRLLDLRQGSVVHVVGATTPKGRGYQIVRSILHALNGQAVSTHRVKRGERYFALRKNLRWKDERYV